MHASISLALIRAQPLVPFTSMEILNLTDDNVERVGASEHGEFHLSICVRQCVQSLPTLWDRSHSAPGAPGAPGTLGALGAPGTNILLP